MNQLINDIFGDKAITLDCESGECLHSSQVPGYKHVERQDSNIWVALSAALAGLIFLVACLCEFHPAEEFDTAQNYIQICFHV